MALNQATNTARRRVIFGVNAVVQALLAAVVVVGVIWLAHRFNMQADWTRTGINSLSSRTAQLLQNLDQNIRITTLFAEPDRERDPLGRKHWRAIKDLLELYDSAGGARVSTYMIDPSLPGATETDKLLKRLQELPTYKDEAQPHQEALAEFPELNQKIRSLAASDFQRTQELVAGAPVIGQNRSFNIVRNNWRVVVERADRVAADIAELSHAEIPRYGQAVGDVRDYLTNTRLRLQDAADWMGGDALSIADLTLELRTFFQEAPDRYAGVLAEIDALLAATEGLKDVKLEEIHRELTRWRSGPPVLVESESEARVIPSWEIWQRPADPGAPVGPDGDDRVFVGEAAISSAILQLTQKDKTGVIFTHYGGKSPIRPDFSQMNPMMRQMPTAPYQRLAGLLEKANFLTEDWDVSQEKTPPEVEGATRVIYVVFPPEPPPRPNPMQPAPQAGMTPEDRQIILDAVEAAGMGVFLAGWMPPASPIPGATGTYEFADYLKTKWGIDVRFTYLVWPFTPNPQKPGWWAPANREPLITSDAAVRLSDHAIAAPSQADRAGFFMACPLAIVKGDDRPAGVQAEVVAEVGDTQDVWALNDPLSLGEQFRRNQGVRRSATDIATPFPIVLAASNPAGHKLVVFGSEQFAADSLAQATGLMSVGNALVLGPLYPANTDLFINALHWLTGEADRIAVGPRSADLPRLADLNEQWANRLPWFLVGIWPAVALLAGIGAWLVRRR